MLAIFPTIISAVLIISCPSCPCDTMTPPIIRIFGIDGQDSELEMLAISSLVNPEPHISSFMLLCHVHGMISYFPEELLINIWHLLPQ
jgi:hypothetical protein